MFVPLAYLIHPKTSAKLPATGHPLLSLSARWMLLRSSWWTARVFCFSGGMSIIENVFLQLQSFWRLYVLLFFLKTSPGYVFKTTGAASRVVRTRTWYSHPGRRGLIHGTHQQGPQPKGTLAGHWPLCHLMPGALC